MFSSPSSTAKKKKKNSRSILQPPDIFDENIDIDELSVNLKETKIAAEEKNDNGLEISEKDFLSDIIDDDSSNCNEKDKEEEHGGKEEEGKNGSNENDLKIFAFRDTNYFEFSAERTCLDSSRSCFFPSVSLSWKLVVNYSLFAFGDTFSYSHS